MFFFKFYLEFLSFLCIEFVCFLNIWLQKLRRLVFIVLLSEIIQVFISYVFIIVLLFRQCDYLEELKTVFSAYFCSTLLYNMYNKLLITQYKKMSVCYPDEGVKPKRWYNTFLIWTRVVLVLYTFNNVIIFLGWLCSYFCYFIFLILYQNLSTYICNEIIN